MVESGGFKADGSDEGIEIIDDTLTSFIGTHPKRKLRSILPKKNLLPSCHGTGTSIPGHKRPQRKEYRRRTHTETRSPIPNRKWRRTLFIAIPAKPHSWSSIPFSQLPPDDSRRRGEMPGDAGEARVRTSHTDSITRVSKIWIDVGPTKTGSWSRRVAKGGIA